VRILTDLAYAPPVGRGHLLDVYRPDRSDNLPVVVWTGGSAWLADNGKDSAEPIAAEFTARGYAVAGVSIRSSAQARFPAQLHDIKAAIRWLRSNAGEYGLDPDRFVVMGDSSGGWTAAMATLTGDRPELEGTVGVAGVSSAVLAGVAFYPPTAFLAMDEQMLPGAVAAFNAMMGLADGHNDPGSPESRLVGAPIQTVPERVRAASPLAYAHRDSPPLLLLHGRLDPLVPHGQSELLRDAILAAGGRVTLHSVAEAGHDWSQVLAPPLGWDVVAAFVAHVVRTGRVT
jgi:acetyl esterase/lipase